MVEFDGAALARLKESGDDALKPLQTGSWLHDYGNLISHIAFCILAYSGIESVIQTAGFVRSWREIHKAYLFLAVTVGVATPLVAGLVCAPINFSEHEGDLVTFYATLINGTFFGILVAALASTSSTMAVNTAFVASSELLERVAHRYGFHWLIVTNRRHSLYRIHLFNALFFSTIIIITSGSQKILADMYAIGLVASFCINMGSLLIYRVFCRHQGSNPLLHEPRRHAYSLDHPGKLLHFSGDRQTSRHRALGRHNRFCPRGGRPDGKEKSAGNRSDRPGRQ